MNDRYQSQPSGSQARPSQRRRRPRCPQCGSKRFRRDPGTSLIVCESGHVLQGYRDEEAQDGDEFNTNRTQMHRRNLKVQGVDRKARRGRKKMSVATKGVWYGARSRYLYFQALQLILRMQIQALLHEMPGLPQEIEAICRDLWALYVSQKQTLVAQPYFEQGVGATDTDTQDKSKAETLAARARRAAQSERESLLAEELEESESIRDRLLDAGVLEETEELASQSDATDRLASSSGWESTIDIESDDDYDKKLNSRAPKKRNRKAKRGHSKDLVEGRVLRRQARDDLDDLLSILHLGCITLRIPITWNDICILIKAGKLPYLNVIHQLPVEMVSPFPAREVRKLDPSRVPQIHSLHRRTVALSIDLYESCGLEFPELNALPILWMYVEGLLLPPTIYTAAKALLAYINIPMHTVPDNVAAPSQDKIEEDEEGALNKRSGPSLDSRLIVSLGKRSTAREVILMAAVILLAKMRFGLDGEERLESFGDDQSWSGSPVLVQWLDALSEQEQESRRDHRNLFDAQSTDLLDMDDGQLDAYLDYAERTLILSQRPSAYQWRRREGIDDLLSCAPDLNSTFPVGAMKESRKEDKDGATFRMKKDLIKSGLEQIYDNETSRVPEPTLLSVDQLRPGDAHGLYSTRDSSESLHPDYVQVLHHASRLVGCRVAEMADTVYAVEVGLIKMLLWRKKNREAEERQKVREEQGKRKPGRPRKLVS